MKTAIRLPLPPSIAALLSFLFSSIAMIEAADVNRPAANKENSLGDRSAELAAKDVFTAGYPYLGSFRGEMDRPKFQSTAQAYAEAVAKYQIVVKKTVPEELPLGPAVAGFANAAAARDPRQLFLQHLNSEARAVRPEYLEKYFPGHWLYYPGSMVVADLAADATVVRLSAVAAFLYDERYIPTRLRDQEHSFLLVPLDSAGRRDWYASEFVTARQSDVDYRNNTVKVKRAQYSSRARPFEAGKAFMAPLVEGVWGQRMFFFNLSTACPRDRNGQTAAGLFREEIVSWYRPGGILDQLDGISFDVMNWKAKWPGFDVDNDGVADEGVVGGENIWRAGVWDFLVRLRRSVGEDFIILSDGGDPEEQQRAVGLMNGMEFEGFGQPRDAWRGFSKSINIARYWRQFNTAKYSYYHAVGKILGPDDLAHRDELYDFVVGAGTCLGFAITENVNKPGDGEEKSRRASPLFFRGADQVPNWLGQPRGELIHHVDRAPDALAGAGVAWDDRWAAGVETAGCTVQRQGGELVISGSSSHHMDPMKVTFSLANPGSEDLTLFFEACSDVPLSGFSPADAVPRYVQVQVAGLPKYPGSASAQRFYNELSGLFGTRGYCPLYFTYRRMQEAERMLRFSITLEEQGRCRLRNLKVLKGTDLLIREFERGVVIANPSLAPASVDLDMIPDGTRLTRLRLTGRETSAELQIDPRAVRVEPVGALFLRR